MQARTALGLLTLVIFLILALQHSTENKVFVLIETHSPFLLLSCIVQPTLPQNSKGEEVMTLAQRLLTLCTGYLTTKAA